MRGPAVEGAPRRRKQPLEPRRIGNHRRGRRLDRQPAFRQLATQVGLACGDLRRGEGALPAESRSVDEAEQALGSVEGRIVVGAVLRADIDCGIVGQPAGAQLRELGGVVARKEHGVPHQREARGSGLRAERHRREGAGFRRHRLHGPRRTHAEQARAEGRRIGIGHHEIGRDPLAIGEVDTDDAAPVLHRDGGHLRPVPDAGAVLLRQFGR